MSLKKVFSIFDKKISFVFLFEIQVLKKGFELNILMYGYLKVLSLHGDDDKGSNFPSISFAAGLYIYIYIYKYADRRYPPKIHQKAGKIVARCAYPSHEMGGYWCNMRAIICHKDSGNHDLGIGISSYKMYLTRKILF